MRETGFAVVFEPKGPIRHGGVRTAPSIDFDHD